MKWVVVVATQPPFAARMPALHSSGINPLVAVDDGDNLCCGAAGIASVPTAHKSAADNCNAQPPGVYRRQ